MYALRLLFAFLFALALVGTAVFITANDPATFLNLPGLILVLGGTVAATILSYPLNLILNSFKSACCPTHENKTIVSDRITSYSEALSSQKKGNIAETEKLIKSIDSPFLRLAAEMMLDGFSKEEIFSALDWHQKKVRAADASHASVFFSMASYAPAFGMIGTLVGLVNMLDTMESGNFEHIGSSMAIALITTFYGVLMANIIFKPLGSKLEQKIERDLTVLTLTKEAIALLSEGKSASYTKELMENYVKLTNLEATG